MVWLGCQRFFGGAGGGLDDQLNSSLHGFLFLSYVRVTFLFGAQNIYVGFQNAWERCTGDSRTEKSKDNNRKRWRQRN